jgi:hypothetical protein
MLMESTETGAGKRILLSLYELSDAIPLRKAISPPCLHCPDISRTVPFYGTYDERQDPSDRDPDDR